MPEPKTLGIGRVFLTDPSIFRERITAMQQAMDQYQLVWQSHLRLREKFLNINALVWTIGQWSIHLLPLSQNNRRFIDAAQARCLRRLTKILAACFSRISHERVRRRSMTLRFSTFIFRAQLRWLGHMLRKPRSDPLEKILFEPRSTSTRSGRSPLLQIGRSSARLAAHTRIGHKRSSLKVTVYPV